MMILIEIGVTIVYAFATIVIGWTGVALLACLLFGALARLRYDRESVMFLGKFVAGLVMLIDAVTISLEIRQEVLGGGDDPLSPYLILVIPLICWLIHLPMGIGAVWLGAKALDIATRRRAARQEQGRE